MPDSQNRMNATVGNVDGARPYSMAGNLPAGAVVAARSIHASGGEPAIRYVSDRPYVPPSYNERPECIGTRSRGDKCHAKASADGGQYCEAHKSQG